MRQQKPQIVTRVHGTIERTTGMLGVRSAAENIRFRIRRSPTPLFSLRRVSATDPSSRTLFPPELETQNGLSLARNDAFATIAGSKLPTCLFASPPENCADPFDFGHLAQNP
jgi:hypothetical protein